MLGSEGREIEIHWSMDRDTGGVFNRSGVLSTAVKRKTNAGLYICRRRQP